MNRYLMIPMAGTLLFLTSCVATVGPRGTHVAVAPPLPAVVELVSPYYVYSGYHYHYRGKGWYYASSKGGRWIALPRHHYPRVVRFKNDRSERYPRYKHHRDDDRYRRGNHHFHDDRYRRSADRDRWDD